MKRDEREALPMRITLPEAQIDFCEHCKELANNLCESLEDAGSNCDVKGMLLAACRAAKDRGMNWLAIVDAAALCVAAERDESFNGSNIVSVEENEVKH